MIRSSPAARTLGFGAAGGVLLPGLLADGGLAPLVVASVAALALGAPLALVVWRAPPPGGPVAPRLQLAADLVGWLVVALAGAVAVAPLPPLGRLAVGAGWVLGAAVARWVGAGYLAALAVLALSVVGLAGAATGHTQTLLVPVWAPVPSWSTALTLGVLGAGAVGPFSAGPARPPGERRAPWAVAGVFVVVSTSLCLWAASRYGAALGAPTPAWGVGLGLAGATTAFAAWLSWRPRGPLLDLRGGLGGLAVLWLAGPGASGVPFLLQAVLPALAGAWLAVRARYLAGVERVMVGLAGLAGLLLAGSSGPALPDAPLDAMALALLGVAGFWILATRWVLGRAVPA